MLILTHYFEGGMKLRALEARPLTDEQSLNIATGGAYSHALAGAHKTGASGKGAGCSLVPGFLLFVGSTVAAAFLL
jgi:hypothetical protein